mgnify:CR=1 FL=1
MERIFVFLRSPGAATSVLLGATVLALILANSPSSEQYFQIVNHHIGNLTILEWVNDALMAIFFLFVGLEVKRELVSGELNTNAKRVMPGIAALFGVLTPAFIYYLIAGFHPEYIHGCSYVDRRIRAGRTADECDPQPGAQHEPYAENKQPGPQDACLRNNGGNDCYLHR